ncbi:MAG: hypothetical protein V7603_5176 [Micromonosporaceae bacterium]
MSRPAATLADPQVEHPMPWLTEAVPAAVAAVAGWDGERRRKAADGYVDAIACGADVLWADPQAARRADLGAEQVRDAIVHGLAILAHRPGGVTFAELHWHANACPACPGAGRWALPPAPAGREARGAFFTPRALAAEIAHNAVGPHLVDQEIMDIVGLQIADIACGSGAFLVAVARLLHRTHLELWTIGDARYFVGLYDLPDEPYPLRGPFGPAVQAAAMMAAVDCVYGVDIDPLSVELTRLALALLLPDHDVTHTLRRQVRCGDSLLGDGQPWWDGAATSLMDTPGRFDWPTAFPEVFDHRDGLDRVGFDVVLGNPPYLGGKKLRGTLGEAYRQHLITNIAGGRRGSADLAVYFWLRAHELVCELGTVGIIGPANLMRGGNLRVWDDHLRQVAHRTLYRTEHGRRWPSTSASISCCLLYSVMRRWIDPQFRDHDPDDPGRAAHHTCDFGVDPPRFGETWQPRPGCPRCDALAKAARLIIRTEREGQAYEIVRHRTADSTAPEREHS